MGLDKLYASNEQTLDIRFRIPDNQENESGCNECDDGGNEPVLAEI